MKGQDMHQEMRGSLILLLTAFIWGIAFVAQSTAMDHIAPFTYMAARYLIGGIVLLPVVYFRHLQKDDLHSLTAEERIAKRKCTLRGGMCCGLILFISSAFQQFGISMTTTGKAGFITALYIIIVPFLSVFFGRKIPKKIWLCVVIAITGFWLLCVSGDFSVGLGDWLVLCCAFAFSAHILAVDHFTAKDADGIQMSCTQFFVAAGLSAIGMLIFEKPVWAAVCEAKWSILYAGVLSSGVAYTLQIIGQKYAKPTTATLMMSLESVFAALAGWLILGEILSGKELMGCVLVFAAVLLAQLPVKILKD